MGEKEERMSWVSGPESPGAVDKQHERFNAVEAGFQELSAAQGARAFNSQEIPGATVYCDY